MRTTQTHNPTADSADFECPACGLHIAEGVPHGCADEATCPWLFADECAMAREREAAGIDDERRPCLVHDGFDAWLAAS